MKGIQSYLQSKEDIQSVIKGILAGMDEQLVAGLSGSARGLLVSAIHGEVQKAYFAYNAPTSTGATII